jgi:hypothetical protein
MLFDAKGRQLRQVSRGFSQNTDRSIFNHCRPAPAGRSDPDRNRSNSEKILESFSFHLGVDDIENPTFAVAVFDGIEDLRDGGAERIREKLMRLLKAKA